MANSYLYLQAEKNNINHKIIESIDDFCNANKLQAYIINKPLGDNKYSYSHADAIVLLIPKYQITFIDFSSNEQSFQSFVEDFKEDLGSISDKFRYKEFIGRPRSWSDLVTTVKATDITSVEDSIKKLKIQDPTRERVCELLISLLTGSVNDIEKVKATIPESILDQVKQKIVLFDGDQTRFIYENVTKPSIRIQGLSGTGKTELLLHKLKELYVEKPDTKIAFTCHNRILADTLRKRIPDFFNFMKVEQQILWNERLWCMHAWGSYNNPSSGTYRYICMHYDLVYESYSFLTTFEMVCSRAVDAIKQKGDHEKPFDHILIDESQDFPESFFELCGLVSKSTVFIAGDIFQNIFDETIKMAIEPDYLLNKCYRTDPRTLMFAHALGMGLYEKPKLRWLDDQEWKACGYLVEKNGSPEIYHLKREPLRRFEDIDREKYKSVEIFKASCTSFHKNVTETIIKIITNIRNENPTVDASDIGIILMDSGKSIYELADFLEQEIPRNFVWEVNKAYETKSIAKNKVFISNRNNVKGLEFPFVICVTERILNSYSFRNTLYMTLTRSFLQTYLVIPDNTNPTMLNAIENGLKQINENGYIEAISPSEQEKEEMKKTILESKNQVSFYDFVTNIFNELDVLPILREDLMDTVRKVMGEEFDYEKVKELIAFNHERMSGRNKKK